MGVRVGRGVEGAFVVRLRFGVVGLSGTLKVEALGAFGAFFGFVVEAFDDCVGFGFLMPLILGSEVSAARFLVFVFVIVGPLDSELGSKNLEERRSDILRTSF